MTSDGQRRRDYLPGLSEAQRRTVLYYTIYPNLLLSLHPDYVMAHRLWPQSVDLHRSNLRMVFPSERDGETGF